MVRLQCNRRWDLGHDDNAIHPGRCGLGDLGGTEHGWLEPRGCQLPAYCSTDPLFIRLAP